MVRVTAGSALYSEANRKDRFQVPSSSRVDTSQTSLELLYDRNSSKKEILEHLLKRNISTRAVVKEQSIAAQ